jgi:hypothetical protein
MIHAFFVTLGVLCAIRFFPLIAGFTWVTLTSKFFWYLVLWLLVLVAAISGFTPLGLIAMVISVPFVIRGIQRREAAEMEARTRVAAVAPQAPLPFKMGDRFTHDGHEIHYYHRTFTPVPKMTPEQSQQFNEDWNQRLTPEQQMNKKWDELIGSQRFTTPISSVAQWDEFKAFQRFMPEI